MNKVKKEEDCLNDFKKRFIAYSEFLGVLNYELFFFIDRDDEGRGKIELNYDDKIAYVYLCNSCLKDESLIDKTAFHEACELVCYEAFSHHLDEIDRLRNTRISMSSTHSMIRLMENIIYDKMIVGKKNCKKET